MAEPKTRTKRKPPTKTADAEWYKFFVPLKERVEKLEQLAAPMYYVDSSGEADIVGDLDSKLADLAASIEKLRIEQEGLRRALSIHRNRVHGAGNA